MGFWDSELGEVTGKAEDAFAKDMFKTIPDGTMALARIESFNNQSHKESNFNYLEISWVLTAGDFKGRKVSQKLKVFGGDSYDRDPAKTKHRALNMLKLLYQLFNVKPTHAGAPTNEDLAVFVNKTAGLKIRETEPNEKGNQYNWIAEVHQAAGFKCETGISIVVTHKAPNQDESTVNSLDNAFSRQRDRAQSNDYLSDDIPF